MSLAFGLGDDQTLRFAAAKQVARPRMDPVRAAVDVGVDRTSGRPGASGRRPRLDPWRADALDLSYEMCFGSKAYVAVAGFYKKPKTYIYTQSRDGPDFSQFVAGYAPPPGSPGAQRTSTFTAPYNGRQDQPDPQQRDNPRRGPAA